MTGINVIGYYQTIMYKALGFIGNRNTLVAGLYNCVDPIANLIFIVFLLDRVGRRKLLLFGTISRSRALICEVALNSQNPFGQRIEYSIGGVFFFIAVSVIFSVSYGSVGWLWNQISPIALGKLQWKFYFVFVAWSQCLIPAWLFSSRSVCAVPGDLLSFPGDQTKDS